MLSDKEILMIQKATIYDLQCILKAESKATYTVEDLKKLMDLYIKTLESQTRNQKLPDMRYAFTEVMK